MSKFVYMFSEGNKDMRNLLGGKGANLAEMTKLGFPVPSGFTITTEACNSYYDNKKSITEEIRKEIYESLEKLENIVGKKLGDKENPLLVSVRSGARASMPGMMDTVLNLGMNDEVCKALAKITKNPRFAYDSYRRFIGMYANVVKNKDLENFEDYLEEYKISKGVKKDSSLSAIDFKEITDEYKRIYKETVGEIFPQDVKKQLMDAIKAVFDSWENDRAKIYRQMNDIPSIWGTAVNVQQMVYGNMGQTSGTGVAFTRNPSTGENKLYGEFLLNAQGEDVVAGIRTPEDINTLKVIMPEVYNEFVEYANKLEDYYKDMQDIEFTIENGKLYLLQTRNAKRTGLAAIKIAVDFVKERKLTKEEAILRVDPKTLDSLLHPTFSMEQLKNVEPLTSGLPASPGCAYGKLCFSAKEAVKRKANGEDDLILVRNETSPEDIEGMKEVNALVTVRGGITSHAAVVARGMGKPCVCGCSNLKINEVEETLNIGNTTLNKNDYISIDGTTGLVYNAKLELVDASIGGDFEKFMSWADETRRMKVRANADTVSDAKLAKKLGAEGIGLCRTEHMFFDKDRIFAFRKMILSNTKEEREKYLEEILPYQIKDFTELFEATYPDSVVIRYLDPPLHEFLPKEKKDIIFLADAMGLNHLELESRIKDLKEVNPMMGHRGCRLLITYEEIVRMQTMAIIEAQKELLFKEKKIKPEIMIPLVSDIRELHYVRKIIDDLYKEINEKEGLSLKYRVGTMIEVPRACLTSREIANVADFYSFGTNDLTQMTYGFSRDDAGVFLENYYKKGILENDPFVKLDKRGVGKLIAIGVREGRKVDAKLLMGVCGEHGGDPASVLFFEEVGLDYISCSPYRVPIARLAAAQATLCEKKNS